MTGLFHKEKKQEYSLEQIANEKVNVIAQCLYTFIPILALVFHIWVFSRIEKLKMGTLYTVIIFGILIGFYFVIEPLHIVNSDSSIYYFIIGLVVTQGIMMYFLVRWSKEWNKKIAEEVSRMMREKHIGDCNGCGQKLDKFYVNCPYCNKVFLKQGQEHESDILNKKFGLV